MLIILTETCEDFCKFTFSFVVYPENLVMITIHNLVSFVVFNIRSSKFYFEKDIFSREYCEFNGKIICVKKVRNFIIFILHLRVCKILYSL